MKKLMIAMVGAAMVGAANAAASYKYQYEVILSPYEEKDTDPKEDNNIWYKCYGMTQDTAKGLLKSSTTVTYSDVADWLEKNFAANSAAVVGQSQALTTFSYYDSYNEVYSFYDGSGDNFDDQKSDYIGVAFFDNGTDKAYKVIGGDPDDSFDYFFINDRAENYSTGWIAVPEPTSGLLMLLGMAGLCLRRKQRV